MTAKTETTLAHQLKTNKAAKFAEMAIFFGIPLAILFLFLPRAEGNIVAMQVLVWIANIFMLLFVWLGLHLRGETWAHFGLTFAKPSRQTVVRAVLMSLVVFVAATAAFVFGSILMANIVGIPEPADMSQYEYLQGNLPLLLLTLVGTWFIASFGEEVIYRGFLITRLEEFGSGGKNATRAAVIVSILIFGVIHYEWGPMGIAQTSCMGLVLAIAYIRLNRNLWITILAHGYMDTILMVQMYLLAGSGATE